MHDYCVRSHFSAAGFVVFSGLGVPEALIGVRLAFGCAGVMPTKAEKELKAQAIAEAGAKAAADASAKAAAAAAQRAAALAEAAAEAQEQAAKRPRVDTQPVPATGVPRQPAPSTGPAAEVVAPTPPASKDLPGMGSRVFMQSCIPYVNVAMPLLLKQHGLIESDRPLPEHAPLRIDSAATAKVRSYKERWSAQNCAIALATRGLYEAGANVSWIDPELVSQKLPSDDPPLAWIVEYDGFAEQVPSGATDPLVRFPTTLDGWSEEAPAAGQGNDGEMIGGLGVQVFPLAGHAYIYAFYYHSLLALRKGDIQRVRLLYECALSTTINLRVATTLSEVAEVSAKSSERIRQETKVAIDNFVVFGDKVAIICGTDKLDAKAQLALLTAKKMAYNGGAINQTMLRTIQQLRAMTSDAKITIAKIDREFGKDVLSGSYNKLRLLMYGCSSGARHETVHPEYVEWCCETLLVTLMRKEAEPDEFKVDTFSSSKETPSWIQLAIATRAVVEHLATLVQNLGSVNKACSDQLQDEVLKHFASPVTYSQSFPIAQASESGDEADAGPDPGEVLMTSLSEKLPRGGVLLAECLRKVYDGTYEEPFAELAVAADMVKVLTDLAPDALGQMGKDIRELMRTLHASESVVPSSSQGVPRASLRQLVRQSSDAGGGQADATATQKEREEVWAKATAHRKKFVSLVMCKDKKIATLTEAYRKGGSGVRALRGAVNDFHRGFVVSADLLHENAAETPWRTVTDPSDKDFGDMLAFITSQKDSADVVMGFDGLSRSARRKIEDTVGKMPAAAEVFLTYQKAPNKWCARKNFLGSRNQEVGYIAMPVNRTKIPVTERKGEVEWEDSTHMTTYTGVETTARNHLALIDPAEKAQLIPNTPLEEAKLPASWRRRGLRGVPLYWMESKSVECWRQILKLTSCKAVLDVSAGSGTLAAACMAEGATYVGFVYHKTHLAWLTNVVDRLAMKFIVESGSYLYQEDLGSHVKQLFHDIVDPEEVADPVSDDDAGAE